MNQSTWMPILLVALGGAFGAVLRWLMVTNFQSIADNQFPLGTFLVNIIGSLAIGLLAAIFLGRDSGFFMENSESLRLLLIVGLLGGFTTFSSYSLETIYLLEAQRFGLAAVYSFGSVLVAVLATGLGLFIGRFFVN